MTNSKTNWTKEDLKVYFLIYCANADFSENKFEDDFIKSKIRVSNFDAIHREFEKDNDFQSLEKIQDAMNMHGYTKEEKDGLFLEVRDLFQADGDYDLMEKNLLRGLKHIF